jgi:hypothetical protein
MILNREWKADSLGRIEAKLSDKVRSIFFYCFRERLKIQKCIQLVLDLESSSTKDDILVTPAYDWLSQPLENKFFEPERSLKLFLAFHRLGSNFFHTLKFSCAFDGTSIGRN